MAITSSTPLKFPDFVILIALLHLLFSAASSLKQNQNSGSLEGLRVEEKIRLGSTPPSCFNKCSNCHPCMAVQVPTTLNNVQVKPGLIDPKKPLDCFDSSSPSVANRYSNYKPLGWKCRCGGHLYNP